jgi:F-type H+-transporting ATPase subunit gamma
MSLKAIKGKIKAYEKTRQVTRAMEAVSAAKMRKAQGYALGARPFAMAALAVLDAVTKSESVDHPLFKMGKGDRRLLVVITADKGLAGAYNAQLLKLVARHLKETGGNESNTDVITIGRRGREYFARRGYNIIDSRERWSDFVRFGDVASLTSLIRTKWSAGEYSSVYIANTDFRSTLKQDPAVRELLPLTKESVAKRVEGLIPDTGRFSELRASRDRTAPIYALEPSAAAVLDAVVPELLNISIYQALLESNASEHSARMVAMKNASDNAAGLARSLKLKFNKVRQAAITREISEIVGGMTSME